MGGFFIHSREGLETEYLSTEWMEDVKFCVDKARENDLELWIYDEDKWPSGAAGGMVSKVNPAEFTARALTMECGKAGEDVYKRQQLNQGKYTAKQGAQIVGMIFQTRSGRGIKNAAKSFLQ